MKMINKNRVCNCSPLETPMDTIGDRFCSQKGTENHSDSHSILNILGPKWWQHENRGVW